MRSFIVFPWAGSNTTRQEDRNIVQMSSKWQPTPSYSAGLARPEDSSYKKPTSERSSLPARLSQDSNICSRNFTDGAGRGRYLPHKRMEKGLGDLPVTLPTVSPGPCQRQEGLAPTP